MNNKKDELRREYPSDLIKSGVRGKYAERMRKEGSRLPRVGLARRGKR